MEPEEVLIDGARHATEAVARLWRRSNAARDGSTDAWLDDQRDRLRLLLAAVYGLDATFRVAQPPAPPPFLRRLLLRLPRGLVPATAVPATDGRDLFLPRSLAPLPGLPADRLYRLLALQQAVRAQRLAAMPTGAWPRAGLEQTLFELSEAVAADRQLIGELPGLTEDISALRAAMLTRRPPLALLVPRERAVEATYRDLLEVSPVATPAAASALESLQWAEDRRARIEADAPGRYRLVLPDYWLGALMVPPPALVIPQPASGGAATGQPRVGRLPRRPAVRPEQEGEDDQSPGMWMLQMDDPQQHVEDPMGLQRPADRDNHADADELGDSLSELAQARLVTTPEPAKEILVSDDPPARGIVEAAAGSDAGIRYPEWDYRIGAYRSDGAIVRVGTPRLGDEAWVEQVMAQRRDELEAVKRRFEGLRPRRVRLARQLNGEDVDIDAYVEAYGDLRAGVAAGERLYQAVRPARRNIAIALLVDVSGSTDAWVGEDLRVIDVEKEALLVVCHALHALGDPYTIQAFSGEGPRHVDVWPVKSFADNQIPAVRRRIAALEPEYYTRAGAAIRHVTTLLGARREQHRLLLLLSDGKPNDIDHYEGRYGAEDMRQAVAEATAQGIHCFCLTVDRFAPAYLNAIFGTGRHTVIRHPRSLPSALIAALRHLLRS